MNPKIYKKIAEVQCALLGRELPKSGYNSFNKFHYHELEDLLPAIMQECFKRDLMIFFNFTEDAGVLKIKDFSTEGVEMNVRVPMPQIKEMRTMNIVQSEGAYITYLKRYLLTNTFLITEKDLADSDGLSRANKKSKKKAQRQPKGGFVDDGNGGKIHEWPVNQPEPIAQAISKIEAKGVEVTALAIRKHIPWNALSEKDRKESMKYIKMLKKVEEA